MCESGAKLGMVVVDLTVCGIIFGMLGPFASFLFLFSFSFRRFAEVQTSFNAMELPGVLWAFEGQREKERKREGERKRISKLV